MANAIASCRRLYTGSLPVMSQSGQNRYDALAPSNEGTNTSLSIRTGPNSAPTVEAAVRLGREDAEQGALGDGWLIAVLGAVAGHLPEEISCRVTARADGTYVVLLADTRCTASGAVPTGRTIELSITADLPVYDHSPGEPAYAKADHAAWPAIAEKALAGVDVSWTTRRRGQWAESWDRICAADAADPRLPHPRYGPPPTGYVRLSQSGTTFDQAEALTQLTGRQAAVRYLPARRRPIRRTLGRQLAAHRPA